MTAEVLGSFTIVLTTYEMLSQAHILHRVPWWRVVLDESQRVRGTNPITQTAAQLRRTHSWLMSGTPAGNVSLRRVCFCMEWAVNTRVRVPVSRRVSQSLTWSSHFTPGD